MYEVLRVPPTKDSYKKAYEIIKAYCGKISTSFDDFYNRTDTIYMLGDGDLYYGAAYIEHAIYDKTPTKFRGNNIYKLSVLTFSDEDLYFKTYDLINTIIRDKNDRIILIQNVPGDLHELINALKNNKFKIIGEESTDELYTMYHYPDISDKAYTKRINPTNDVDVVDKMIQDRGVPGNNRYL